jgi:competence protein ComEC
MLPLMARDFHRITLAGPLVNLIAVPLTGLIVPLGFIALTSSLLVPAVGRLLSVPLQWLIVFLLHSIAWFAHFPSASYRIPGPRTSLMLAFFVVAILLAIALHLTTSWRRRAAQALTSALLACAGLVALFPFSPRWSRGKLEATILDVGQGDAIFVVSPQGQTLLIDGGGAFRGFPGHPERGGMDPGEEAISPYLWSRGFRKIDVVALTHAHQDHLGGLTAILENFRVGRLWIGREATSPALARLEELARAKHISIEHEGRGQTFPWSGTEAAFFWPGASSGEIASAAQNNDSLVLRLRYGNRTILLPGDAEKDAERTMLADDAGEGLRADVLKVGHHGSKNSTMPEFLAAVRPRMAIISTGEENPYGHPSPALLARLQDAGVSVYRTDRDGAVRVVTDGESLTVSCFVACPALTTSEALRQTQSPDDEQQHEQQ